MHRRHARRSLAALAAVAAALLVGLFAAPTAQASINQITCLGSSTQTFSPGLTNTPQPTAVTISTSYTNCLSLTAPSITSGSSFSAATTPDGSCTSILESSSTPRPTTITWNTGETSTITQTTAITSVGGQVVATSTGTVTAGKFLGATSIRVVTYLGSLITEGCASPAGLPSNTGPATLNIIL